MTKYEFQVSDTQSGQRIDKYLSSMMGDFSRSYLQKLLKDGQITINGGLARPSSKTAAEDKIEVLVPDLAEPDIKPENIPLDILYEDDDLILVNKPKGMVVHPAAGHSGGTLVNALMFHCKGQLSGINGITRPGIVHRIDRDTTGVLVVCKNDRAHNCLADQLKVHSITRRYRAIVHGVLKEDGIINAPIGRHSIDRKKMAVNPKNGKEAVTHYHILEPLRNFTYIECELETGRTHQIRVHMASIGHPLLGDEVYGPSKCPVKGLQGQTLHAMVLGFIHPTTLEYVEYTAPLPPYFTDLLNALRIS
ncbi:RluA family pseudouridine synthase [Diplocloster agilis]|uniref:RluA family pseudouridine synthase n=1 Tax=Diplocloster agilis TaxID=2850323 RepID=UPI0008202DE8|nr:RluA family pseudouridine synthase [Suonthocola fibrivorans]MCU6733949.1 RluA family pseudouridine synthase [Suonthocola fibrivorans]SCJ16269.1 Ribosomal large subunit pseudouridine synthase D [uncultured Clostridium sp.]